jgi:hypothetical protein
MTARVAAIVSTSLALVVLAALPGAAAAQDSACIFKAEDLKPLFGEVRAEPYASKGPMGGPRCEYRVQRASINVQLSPRAGKALYKKVVEQAKNGALVHKEITGVGDAAYFTDTGGAVLTGTRMIAVSGFRQAAGRTLTDEEATGVLKLALERAGPVPVKK